MGIPYPPAIKKAIEVLQKRASHIDDEIQEMIDNMEDDISLNTVMTRSLIRKSLNWCRRKSKDEKGSARNTAAVPVSQRKSSAPAVEGSSARKCGIAQANTGELSGSAITNFPSLPETKSVKRHICMRTR